MLRVMYEQRRAIQDFLFTHDKVKLTGLEQEEWELMGAMIDALKQCETITKEVRYYCITYVQSQSEVE